MTRTKTRSVTSLLLIPLMLMVLFAVDSTVNTAQADPNDQHLEIAKISGEGNQRAGRWQTFDITVPHDTTIEATARWQSSGDVNIFLYKSSNKDRVVAKANSLSSRPETFSYDARAGEYTLAVLVKSGSAAWDVTVEAAGPRRVAVVTGTGNQEAGRWQLYPLSLEGASQLTIIGNWTGGGDVNLFLRDGTSKKTLGYANGADRPERITFSAQAGTYELAVLVKSGSANYRVEVFAEKGASAGPPSAPPSPSPTPSPEPRPPTPSPAGAYPGQPAAGTVVWGASIGGNADPRARHESAAGTSLALRRTFFQWRHRTSYLPDTARGDLEAGRLPWVSIKTPSWAAMARGDHDAQIDELLRGLDKLDGPVWLTMHHEPEGGGGRNYPDDSAGPSGHLAMNKRVRARMTALGTDNIALAPILMTYTWDDYSRRNPNEWWAPGVYDFLGVDHYQETESSLVNDVWRDVRKWAQARDVDVAVGEWGMRGTDAAAGQRVRQWHGHAVGSYRDGAGARVVGLAAFDSGLHSPTGSWVLRGAQLSAFQDLMDDPHTATLTSLR